MYFDICYLVMYPILYLENISVKERHAPPLPQMVEMIFFLVAFFSWGGGWVWPGTQVGNAYVQCWFIWDVKKTTNLVKI